MDSVIPERKSELDDQTIAYLREIFQLFEYVIYLLIFVYFLF